MSSASSYGDEVSKPVYTFSLQDKRQSRAGQNRAGPSALQGGVGKWGQAGQQGSMGWGREGPGAGALGWEGVLGFTVLEGVWKRVYRAGGQKAYFLIGFYRKFRMDFTSYVSHGLFRVYGFKVFRA